MRGHGQMIEFAAIFLYASAAVFIFIEISFGMFKGNKCIGKD